MMGKTHMTVAAASYCAYSLPSHIEDVFTWGMGLGVAILTSLIPDIDEPRSRIGGIILPMIPSWLRPMAFLLIGGYLLYVGWTSAQWVLLSIGSLLLFFVCIKHRESPTHAFIGLVIVTSLLYANNTDLLIPALIGYGSHLLMDLITEGISLFWPIPTRIRIPLMRTNSWLERWVIYRGAQVVTIYMFIQAYHLQKFIPIW